MINYELKFGVSEIARILKVDKRLVKDWTYHFSTYLNPKANPEKGLEREYTTEDICTLGYISTYWEDNPDIENIKYGLNSNDQFDYPYNEFVIQAMPIFREFSEDLLGGKIWMIGGMAGVSDILNLADSYKKAGDSLVNIGIQDEENKELIYPAIYNYRHATELYLKSVLPKYDNTHRLQKLYEDFKTLLQNSFNTTPPNWFENIIIAFDEFDPSGTTFRYGVQKDNGELFIDLIHIKKLINWFSESIHNIKARLSEIEK